jgi:hypothetical protein
MYDDPRKEFPPRKICKNYKQAAAFVTLTIKSLLGTDQGTIVAYSTLVLISIFG